jgi:hypothetical protein
MTRFLIAFALALAPLPAFAYAADTVEIPKDADSGFYKFQGVVNVEGASADQLLSRARAWIATTYRSAKDVVQLDDPTAGRIIAKGLIPVRWMGETSHIRHTLTVEAKDGRYRYTIADLVFDQGNWSRPLEDESSPRPGRNKVLQQTKDGFEALLASLQAAMTTGKDENW